MVQIRIFRGLMDKQDVPSEYIVESQGVRLACNFDPSVVSRYKECVIDFIEGRFVFIDANMRDFLD